MVQWPEHMRYAAEMVGPGGYVTQLVQSDNLDPAKWQVFMDLCAQHGLIPVIRLATVFDEDARWWEPPPAGWDGRYRGIAQDYAKFVAALRWPSGEHFVIVGNEPNHGNEWGGVPDPAAYAAFLVDVARALHEADPQVRVLNAPLDTYAPHSGGLPMPDGMVYLDAGTFMDQMAAAQPEVWQYLDAWATHSYPAGPFIEPPWIQTYAVDYLNAASNPAHQDPPPGIPNRGINSYEWELWKLSTYGVEGLPVFLTETGWRHSEAVDPASPDNSRPLPDAETVAIYFDLSLNGNPGTYPQYPVEGWTPWLDDPRIVAITPFALDGDPAQWSHTNWLILDPAGDILGVYAPYTTLTEMHP